MDVFFLTKLIVLPLYLYSESAPTISLAETTRNIRLWVGLTLKILHFIVIEIPLVCDSGNMY